MDVSGVNSFWKDLIDIKGAAAFWQSKISGKEVNPENISALESVGTVVGVGLIPAAVVGTGGLLLELFGSVVAAGIGTKAAAGIGTTAAAGTTAAIVGCQSFSEECYSAGYLAGGPSYSLIDPSKPEYDPTKPETYQGKTTIGSIFYFTIGIAASCFEGKTISIEVGYSGQTSPAQPSGKKDNLDRDIYYLTLKAAQVGGPIPVIVKVNGEIISLIDSYNLPTVVPTPGEKVCSDSFGITKTGIFDPINNPRIYQGDGTVFIWEFTAKDCKGEALAPNKIKLDGADLILHNPKITYDTNTFKVRVESALKPTARGGLFQVILTDKAGNTTTQPLYGAASLSLEVKTSDPFPQQFKPFDVFLNSGKTPIAGSTSHFWYGQDTAWQNKFQPVDNKMPFYTFIPQSLDPQKVCVNITTFTSEIITACSANIIINNPRPPIIDIKFINKDGQYGKAPLYFSFDASNSHDANNNPIVSWEAKWGDTDLNGLPLVTKSTDIDPNTRQPMLISKIYHIYQKGVYTLEFTVIDENGTRSQPERIKIDAS